MTAKKNEMGKNPPRMDCKTCRWLHFMVFEIQPICSTHERNHTQMSSLWYDIIIVRQFKCLFSRHVAFAHTYSLSLSLFLKWHLIRCACDLSETIDSVKNNHKGFVHHVHHIQEWQVSITRLYGGSIGFSVIAYLFQCLCVSHHILHFRAKDFASVVLIDVAIVRSYMKFIEYRSRWSAF